jgi:hypothetical protein
MPAGLGRRVTEVGVKPSASSCRRFLSRSPRFSTSSTAMLPSAQRPPRRCGLAALALEEESFSNYHAAQLMSALGLVASQPRSVRDRFIDIAEIVEARGRVTIHIRRP